MIYLALPEDGPKDTLAPGFALVPCDSEGEPTEFRIPPWVYRALREAEDDGLVPGSYMVLWMLPDDHPTYDAEVRVADFNGDEIPPYDLVALWDEAEVLP